MTDRSFRDYFRSCNHVVNAFGRNRVVDDLATDDFARLRTELSKTRGPVALGNEITRIRMLFKFGYDEGLIEKPMRYGQSFKKPSKKTLRQERERNGPRMFESDELRRIIGAAPQPLRTMTLLAINCGFGQSDVANLPRNAVDLEGGWITYARAKTGIPRRCPLWPRTIEALRDAIENRPEPNDTADADCVFLTSYGNRWVRMSNHEDPSKRTAKNAVAQQFAKLLQHLGINGQRNFYAAKHSFQTVAEDSRDLPAVKHIMGHADDSMSAVHRERISDERLRAVVAVVHEWLFGQ